MSGFLFNRQPSDKKADPAAPLADAVQAVVQAQSITASAIFAMLVAKGVISAGEAALYMGEIAEALERDVPAPAGPQAGETLAQYARALVAAEG
jgi:hypothetical protein